MWRLNKRDLEITSAMPRARISKISGFYVVTSHEAAASTRPVKRSTLLLFLSFHASLSLSLSFLSLFPSMRIAFVRPIPSCKLILLFRTRVADN